MGRLRRALLTAAAVAVLAGCQVHTAVGIDVGRDGSGVVRVGVGLDADAARRVPNLASELHVDDLRAAGWRISGPRREADGRTWVRAEKRFARPEEVGTVLAEVSGPSGPFRGFSVHRAAGFLRTRTTVRGTVDLSAGVESVGDEDLRRRLGGSSLGAPAEALERQLGEALARVFTVSVDVRLPGRVESNAPLQSGGTARWRPRLGERVTIEATATAINTRRLAGATLATAALAALAALAARRWRHAWGQNRGKNLSS